MNLTKLVAAINQVIGAQKKDIMWELMNDSSIEPLVTDCRTVFGIQENQYYVGNNAFMSSVWQGYVKREKQANGELEIIPNMIYQRRHMVKTPIFPDDIRGTILGQMAREDVDIKVKDIVKFLKEGMLKRVGDDRVAFVIYWGKYLAHANGEVWPASDAVDGFNEVVEAGLEHADEKQRINGWDIGALDEDTVYLQLNDAVKQTPAKFRRMPMNLYLADSLHINYKEQREEEIGLRVMTEDKSAFKLKDTNWTIRPSIAMEGSKRTFASPAGNMVKIHDKKEDLGNVEVFQKDIDELTLHGNWCEAYGFDFNKVVWANIMSNNGSGGGDENETFVD